MQHFAGARIHYQRRIGRSINPQWGEDRYQQSNGEERHCFAKFAHIDLAPVCFRTAAKLFIGPLTCLLYMIRNTKEFDCEQNFTAWRQAGRTSFQAFGELIFVHCNNILDATQHKPV